MKAKAEIVLRALLFGQEVQDVQGNTFCILPQEPEDDFPNGVFCIKHGDQWLQWDMSVSLFLKLCADQTDEQIGILAASNGLKSMVLARARSRDARTVKVG